MLRDGSCLSRWLTDHGVEPALLEAIFQNHVPDGGPPASSGRPLSRAEQVAWIADGQRLAGAADAALAGCDQALQLDPNLAYAYAVRGLLRLQQQDFRACVADLTQALERGFPHAGAYYARAIALDGLDRPEDALADCDKVLELQPEHAEAYNSRGYLHGRLGQSEEAVADLTRATQLAPQWALPHFNLGQFYHARGDLDQAIAEYDEAIRLMQAPKNETGRSLGNPQREVVHCRRGEARFDSFREEEAERDFAEARSCNPAGAAEYLGHMWLRRGRLDRAEEEFGRVVDLRPKRPDGYLGRGLAREASGRLEEAAEDYSEAIRRDPNCNGYALQAGVRQRQGRLEEALADLSEQLQRHPENVPARLQRAHLYRQAGRLALARDDFTAAHQAAPEDPLVCNNLAWFLATCPEERFRDGPRAVELARRACQATEWMHPFCLGTLGAAYAETGAFAEAERWQSEAMALYPDEEKPAGEARLELYRQGKPYRE